MKLQLLEISYRICSYEKRIKDVLPFYEYSFEVLNPNEDYIAGYGYNHSFQDTVTEALRKICKTIVPDYYYDIRNWEDFSCAAPQYMLLDKLGWNRTKPISLKMNDDVDLFLALENYAVCSPNDSVAVFTVSLEEEQQEKLLILLLKKSNDITQGKFCLEDFEIETNDKKNKRISDNGIEVWLNLNLSGGDIVMENKNFRATIKYIRGKKDVIQEID